MGQAFAFIPGVQCSSSLPKGKGATSYPSQNQHTVVGCCLHSDPGFARATTHKFKDMWTLAGQAWI